MKLRMITILVLLAGSFRVQQVYGCDVCGGGASAYGSILPMFQSNLAGLRYQQFSYLHPAGLNQNGSSTVLEDRYQQWECWLRFRVQPNLFFSASLPWKQHTRIETEYRSQIQGLGDMRWEAAWVVFNTADSMRLLGKHMLQAVGGIKLNNGKYMQRLQDGVMAPLPLQTGTGAPAAWLRAEYVRRRGRIGMHGDVQYMHYGTNELTYQLGTQLTASLRGFWWLYRGNTQWMLQVAVQADHFAADRVYGAVKPDSGGQRMQGSILATLMLKTLVVQAEWMHPLWQDFGVRQPRSSPTNRLALAMFF
jgi:hypothetical protein